MFATYSGTSQDNFADSFWTAFFVNCAALFFLLVLSYMLATHCIYMGYYEPSKRISSISNILSAIPTMILLIGYQKLPVMWGDFSQYADLKLWVKRLSAVH